MRKNKIKRILLGFSFVLIVFVIAGCNSTENSTNENTDGINDNVENSNVNNNEGNNNNENSDGLDTSLWKISTTTAINQ